MTKTDRKITKSFLYGWGWTSIITCCPGTTIILYGVGTADGLGAGVGLTEGTAVGDGAGVGVRVDVAVAVGETEGIGVFVAVAVGVTLGGGVGLPLYRCSAGRTPIMGFKSGPIAGHGRLPHQDGLEP